MAIPNLPSINSYDVNLGTTITYQANNGYTPVLSSRIYILDVNENLVGSHLYVAQNSAEGATTHVLPAIDDISWVWEEDAIENNKQYIMYIVAYSDEEGTSAIGAQSNQIGFWTLPQPTLSINLSTIQTTEIDVTSYNVTAIYDTNDATINNAPSQYQFSLYNATSDILISKSKVIYGMGIDNYDGTFQINYTFNGLRDGATYYIIVEVVSLQGMIAQDGLDKNKKIKPVLAIAPINVLTAENNCEEGCVELRSSITQILGKMTDGSDPDDYITQDGINLTTSSLVWSGGLSFSANWNFSFWANDFTYAENISAGNEDVIIHLANTSEANGGIIDVYMLKDENDEYQKAVMVVYPMGYDGIASYFESNEVEIPIGQTEFTWFGIQYKDYVYSIEIDNVTIPSEN